MLRVNQGHPDIRDICGQLSEENTLKNAGLTMKDIDPIILLKLFLHHLSNFKEALLKGPRQIYRCGGAMVMVMLKGAS